MSTLVKNKILTGLVILLLIANITTIVMFWMGMKRIQPGRQGQQPSEFLIKELSLNDSQQQQYKGMVKQHRQQTRRIQEQLKANKDSFFDLLSHENIVDSIKNNFAANTVLLNRQLDLITFDHFKEVRKICTPGQQKKFDSIIKDILKMMGGPGPKGNRPPPDEAPMGDNSPPER